MAPDLMPSSLHFAYTCRIGYNDQKRLPMQVELMLGNVKFRWFLLASIALSFLTSCASTGTLDNTSSTSQINTSREVKLEGEERAKCEWEREPEKPGEEILVCVDYSKEPRVQGYELCPPGWHDKFVASPEMRKIQRGIDAVAREKKSSIENQEFEKAAELRDKEEELRANLEKKKDNWVGDNDAVRSKGESRNKEPVRSGICIHNTNESRQCKAGRGCRKVIQYEQCLWDMENVYYADLYGEGASWFPCEKF